MTTASPDRPEHIFASVEVNEVALAFEFPALPERLWAALTSPAKLAAWFPADLHPRVGHRFTLRPDPRNGLAGPTVGEVVAVDEPHRLVLRLYRAEGPATLTCLVEPAQGGCRLRVTQSGPLDDAAEVTRAYRYLFGERLGAVLRGGLLARVARRPPSAETQPGLVEPPAAEPPLPPLPPPLSPGEPVLPPVEAPSTSDILSVLPADPWPTPAHPLPRPASPAGLYQSASVRPDDPAWPRDPYPPGAPVTAPSLPVRSLGPVAPTSAPVAGPPAATGSGSAVEEKALPVRARGLADLERAERVEALPIRRSRRANRPQSTDGRRRPLIPVLVALVIAFGLFLFAQNRFPTADPAAGVGPSPTARPASPGPGGPANQVPGSGPAPGGTAAGPGGATGLGAGEPPPGISGPPPPGGPPPSPPPGPPLPLTVDFVVGQPTLLSYTVTVTVANPADHPQPWSNVMVHFTGIKLKVTGVGSLVTYRALPPDGCFLPEPSFAMVAPHATVTFTFTVTAIDGTLLANVSGVGLDQAACAS